MDRNPNKVLSSRAVSSTNLESWPYEEFAGDPYWENGTTPKSYRWEIELTVQSQVHGSPTTPTPYRYNGFDVYVGDWIADNELGKSLKIIQVIEKDTSSVSVVAEDVDRYNTFQDEDGSGIFPLPSNVVIFSISDMKLPILNPLPSDVSVTFSNEVMARFQNNNPLYSFRFYQTNHGLSVGQSVWVNPGTGVFELATGDNLKKMAGTIDKNVSPDIFYLEPTTKIIEGIIPVLPGSAGDIIYADILTGELTVDPEGQTKAAYIQLTNPSPDSTAGTSDLVIATWVLNINTIDVEFTSDTLISAANDINAKTDQHQVVASVNQGTTTSSSIQGNQNYGQIICQGLSTEITLNGVPIVFDDDTSGSLQYGAGIVNAVDISTTINSANITDITATGIDSSSLVITNNQGGPIDIVNVVNDAGSAPFAGPASCSGLELSASGGGSNFLSFVNDKGSGIIFKNTTGNPVAALELVSVRNGREPLGLVVEQSILAGESTGGVTVYADIPSLPATGVVGEQAYVIDSDDGNGNKDGEWTMFLWDGGAWVKTSDEDSAATDANSETITLTPTSGTQELIAKMSNNSRVTLVSVDVNIAFNGDATLTVGDSSVPNRLMTVDDSDLTWQSTYVSTSDYLYNTGSDTDINAYFDPAGSTVGEAIIVLSYQ